MITFVIKARKCTNNHTKLQQNIGANGHFEIIAHSIMNAFFISNDFRKNVEFYIILDSTTNFPYTIKLSSIEGLSFKGFHEQAILQLIEFALSNAQNLTKDAIKKIAAGLYVMGFGFEQLIKRLLPNHQHNLYLLNNKGVDIREQIIHIYNPLFILSDHLAMPKKTILGLKRQGVQALSLGKKILFASQCVTLLHYEMDRINYSRSQ